MGTIDIVRPLSTDLSVAVNKSQQHREKNSWERRESNPGLLGEKQVCYLCAMQPPIIALRCCSCAPEDDLRVPPGQHEGPRHHQLDGDLLEGIADLQPSRLLRQVLVGCRRGK